MFGMTLYVRKWKISLRKAKEKTKKVWLLSFVKLEPVIFVNKLIFQLIFL